MSSIVRLVSLSVLLFASALVSAGAFDAGDYHEATCTRCHGTGVYTRENRRVKSYPALQSQVARCDANLGTKLFPEDLGLLVDHLNDQSYQFSK